MKIQPNDKCFCGSNKKYKYCCSPKKPRIDLHTISISSDKFAKHAVDKTLDIELFIDNINDTSSIIDANSRELISQSENYVTHGYFGDSKFKNIYQIPDNINNIENIGLSIFQKFNSVIAIDTNRFHVKSAEFYLGAAFQFEFKPEDKKIIEPYFLKLFRLETDIKKPENLNWKRLIEYLMQHKHYDVNARIALIVDSDLENIPDYNKRNKPIYENFLLPNNFTLIYATSDKKDSFINHMIFLCDNFLKQFASDLRSQ